LFRFFLSRSGFGKSMSFRTATFLLSVSIALACDMDRAVAAEANCGAHPASISRSEGRWIYRTIRTTGKKCWFLRSDRKSVRRVAQGPVVPDHRPQSRPLQQAVSDCAASRDVPAPRNAQWRYHFDQVTGQKCWRLARVALKQAPMVPARKAVLGRSRHIVEGRQRPLRSAVDARANLLSPRHETPRLVARAGDGETNGNATGQPPLLTFDSRWLPAEIILFANATTAPSPGSVPILDREEEAAPDVMESQAQHSEGFDSESMLRLLGATLMSVGIALGLYALIGSSAAPWRRTRDRLADSRSRPGAPFVPSSPPIDSTISDIVERLSREDALSEGHEPGVWEPNPIAPELSIHPVLDQSAAITRRLPLASR
jgi:hypothetical protein